MNKKIKVIELFKMREFPKKIKFKEEIYVLKCKTNSIEHLYEIDDIDACIGWLEKQDINIFDEVEVLEDNTEEIEELQEFEYVNNYDKNSIEANRQKINELVKAVNSIRKDKNK
jgi:hypothetical protein